MTSAERLLSVSATAAKCPTLVVVFEVQRDPSDGPDA